MVLIASAAGVLVLVAAALGGRIHFEENFDDDSWKDRWVTSTHDGVSFGKFERTSGTYYGDPDNTGLRTMENDKDYALSTKFSPFNITNKTLVLQFSLKHERALYAFCSEGHLTLYGDNFKPSDTHKGTPFFLMFGTYSCYHLNLDINLLGGERLQSKIDWKEDEFTHVYTLILESNMTYQVLIDGEQVPSDKITNNLPRKPTGSRNAMSPSICGIGLVFSHFESVPIFDNILLSDDVGVAQRKRNVILDDMARMERLRTPWLVDISSEDLTRILNRDEDIELKDNNQTNHFLVEFDKFLVPFDWNSNNTVINAAAEYNKYHGASNQSIQLWVSFQPRNENISVDIDPVLEIVNEANSMFGRTVTVIVINYGFLELDRQTLPFVNKEIQRVKNKLKSLPVPAPKLALQIADTNCKHIENIKYLEINLSEFLVMMPMPPGKKFAVMNIPMLEKALLHCITTSGILKRRRSFVYHTHSSIEIDFEKGIYKYEKSFLKIFFGGNFLATIHAADIKMLGKKDMADAKQRQVGKDVVNWLYQPSGFSKSHFGTVISRKDNELLALQNDAFTIFDSFQHILIHVSRKESENDNTFKTTFQDITRHLHLKKGHGGKGGHGFRFSEGNTKLQTSILVTFDSFDFEVNKRHADIAISAALEINRISPVIINKIFIEWPACGLSKTCSGSNENVPEHPCIVGKRISEMVEHVKETITPTREEWKGYDTSSETGENGTISVVAVVDKQFWNNAECISHRLNGRVSLLCCKTIVRHEDIVRYGGVQAAKIATDDFSLCNLLSHEGKIQFYFYVNIVGCVGGDSNMTLLIEYARLMENLNKWAEQENVLLFVNAGAEVPSKCSENVERNCNCGWWIKQESHDKYQDKKTVARQLYEEAEADEERSKKAVPTESFVWLWVLVAILVLVVLFSIPTAVLIFHYRSKYILTKQEVEDFIKGRLAIRAESAEEEGEAAETQSYNSEKYELALSEFIIDITSSCLGSGEFGRVYPGSIRRDGEVVKAAVKIADTSRLVGKSHGYYLALKGLLSEIKVLAYVGEHNHIVSLLGAYTKKLRQGDIAVFLELCQLGSLDKYLHSMKPQMVNVQLPSQIGTLDTDAFSLDEEKNESGEVQVLDKESSDQLFKWAGEIASGMEFLASKKLVHADLATRNVLLTSDKVAKICDFGSSRRLYEYTEYVKQSQGAMPWRWMAPESLCRSIFNEKTDIWAFGVTLWEMFTLGDQPYPGLTWIVNFPSLLDRGLRLPEPRFNLNEIYSVMLRCWNINPALRPTFNQLKSELNSV